MCEIMSLFRFTCTNIDNVNFFFRSTNLFCVWFFGRTTFFVNNSSVTENYYSVEQLFSRIIVRLNNYLAEYPLRPETCTVFRFLHFQKVKWIPYTTNWLSNLIPLVSSLNLLSVGIDFVVYRWDPIFLFFLFLNTCSV